MKLKKLGMATMAFALVVGSITPNSAYTWVFESKEHGMIYVDCINRSVVSK